MPEIQMARSATIDDRCRLRLNREARSGKGGGFHRHGDRREGAIVIYLRSKTKPLCPRHGNPLIYTRGKFGGFYCCQHYASECSITANKSEFDGHFHMTDQQTRDRRKLTHAVFDPIWQNGPARI